MIYFVYISIVEVSSNIARKDLVLLSRVWKGVTSGGRFLNFRVGKAVLIGSFIILLISRT